MVYIFKKINVKKKVDRLIVNVKNISSQKKKNNNNSKEVQKNDFTSFCLIDNQIHLFLIRYKFFTSKRKRYKFFCQDISIEHAKNQGHISHESQTTSFGHHFHHSLHHQIKCIPLLLQSGHTFFIRNHS